MSQHVKPNDMFILSRWFCWARRSTARERRDRDLKVARPATPPDAFVGPFSCWAAGQTRPSEVLSVGARTGRHGPCPIASCWPPALRWAGRSYPPPDRPFLSNGDFFHSNPENFLSHIISASFRHHFYNIGRRLIVDLYLYPSISLPDIQTDLEIEAIDTATQ